MVKTVEPIFKYLLRSFQLSVESNSLALILLFLILCHSLNQSEVNKQLCLC